MVHLLILNTDACSCTFPDDVFPFKMLDDSNLDEYFYDDNVQLYKLEYKDGLKHERCKNFLLLCGVLHCVLLNMMMHGPPGNKSGRVQPK